MHIIDICICITYQYIGVFLYCISIQKGANYVGLLVNVLPLGSPGLELFLQVMSFLSSGCLPSLLGQG